MRVVLAGVNAKYIHSNLAVRYLKAYTEDLGYDCIIREFSINDRVERVLEEIMSEKPDIVGFSCYIWNIDFVIQVANLIKRIDETIEILYGGPEVSFECESFLKENVGDYVIEGEGEETYREFIRFKLGEISSEYISGLYRKVGKEGSLEVLYSGPRELMEMDKLVFPYSVDEEVGNKIVYYEASRGCPFNCKYCLSSTIKGVRFLNTERVRDELQFLMDKKVRLVKFVDRTFNCSSKFAKEIWSFIIKADTETTFHFEISGDILKMDEIELLHAAPPGRIQFEVGVQTTNNDVLKNINRNIEFNDIKVKVEALQESGNIKQHLDLIAGLPGEDFSSFRKSFNDVYSIGPEEIQLGFLKLLKGSSMREEAEQWGIVYSPYPPYEILKSKDISYSELVILKRVEDVVDKYYNSGKFSTILRFFVEKFDEPFSFYYELGNFFYDKGYFARNISGSDYYKVFLEFYNERFNDDTVFLMEIIKFDYLKYNKKKWLPDFLWRSTEKFDETLLRKKLAEEKVIKDTDKIHFEKFRADVLRFLVDGIPRIEDKYYIFNLEDSENIIDVTQTMKMR